MSPDRRSWLLKAMGLLAEVAGYLRQVKAKCCRFRNKWRNILGLINASVIGSFSDRKL